MFDYKSKLETSDAKKVKYTFKTPKLKICQKLVIFPKDKEINFEKQLTRINTNISMK